MCDANRYDGSVYLCGYVIELAIKARICKHLRWPGFPQTGKEFDKLHSFKTHDLNILFRLSGIEAKVKRAYLAEWSFVLHWDPEVRYNPVGTATRQAAEEMISAARTLLGVIV